MATPPKEVPPEADFSAPPPYETLDYRVQMTESKLPTYEEVQIEKGEIPAPHPRPQPTPAQFLPIHMAGRSSNAPGTVVGVTTGVLGPDGAPELTYIAIDGTDPDTLSNGESSFLGTDVMFLSAFLVAFLFNWVGFLMLTCFCHTIAARYGALSGFGLSLAKWTLIVKNSTDLASHENAWLWWLIMAFGFLICVRAIVQYVSIKRTWRLLTPASQERLLYFY